MKKQCQSLCSVSVNNFQAFKTDPYLAQVLWAKDLFKSIQHSPVNWPFGFNFWASLIVGKRKLITTADKLTFPDFQQYTTHLSQLVLFYLWSYSGSFSLFLCWFDGPATGNVSFSVAFSGWAWLDQISSLPTTMCCFDDLDWWSLKCPSAGRR